jgi:lauroyl/myristoyl acyltransferase
MNVENNSRPLQAEILKRHASLGKRPAFLASDVAVTVLLALSVPVLTVLPERAINPMVKMLSRILPATLRQHASPAVIGRTLGVTEADAQAVFRDQLEARLQSIFWFMRYMVRGRKLDLQVDGAEQIDRALAQGKGVIVWIADLVFCSESVRQALHLIGHPSAHMSRPEHGFSQTGFGVKVLNPIRTNAENKFLQQRITFDRNAPAAAIHKMNARLKENGVVSLVACADEGKAMIEAGFLGGRTMLAAGGPRLAFTSGCPILPAFAVPSDDPPDFKVVIGAPLAMTSKKRDEALLEAANDFLSRLEPYVRAYPHLWRGWPSLAEAEAVIMRGAESIDEVDTLRVPAASRAAR